jgi:uncharacterized protein (TIGR00661 family)
MKEVLVSPLSWGLGHATRDLPIIRYLLERGHGVTIAAEGRALALLKQEVPQCEFLELKDYPAPYTSSPHFIRQFLAMSPVMLKAIWKEGRAMRQVLRDRPFDLILSDNRFNVRSRDVPSFVISHQLRFKVPPELEKFEFVTELFNWEYLKPFDRVIVPDYADAARSLSGRLSHEVKHLARNRKIYYAGAFSSVERMDVPQDVDVFLSISGPEPQRTELERIILGQVERLPGRCIVVTLGKPEVKEVRRLNSRITVYGYLNRRQQQEMLNRARLVVCRSGYTTIMELAELGKKALFIPTPGQTEQEYLGRYHRAKGFFHSVSQYALDLPRDLEAARRLTGVPVRADTRAAVQRLYRDMFAPVLD